MGLQTLRVQLAGEHQLQLDRAEGARRQDAARAEERVQQLARRGPGGGGGGGGFGDS